MPNEDKTFDMLKHGECCRCTAIGQELHTCPFQTEINDDYAYECNCCDDCMDNCCMDI